MGWKLVTPLDMGDTGGSGRPRLHPLRPQGAVRPAREPPDGTVTVTGVVRPHESGQALFVPDNDVDANIWHWWALPAMAEAAGVERASPFILQAEARPGRSRLAPGLDAGSCRHPQPPPRLCHHLVRPRRHARHRQRPLPPPPPPRPPGVPLQRSCQPIYFVPFVRGPLVSFVFRHQRTRRRTKDTKALGERTIDDTARTRPKSPTWLTPCAIHRTPRGEPRQHRRDPQAHRARDPAHAGDRGGGCRDRRPGHPQARAPAAHRLVQAARRLRQPHGRRLFPLPASPRRRAAITAPPSPSPPAASASRPTSSCPRRRRSRSSPASRAMAPRSCWRANATPRRSPGPRRSSRKRARLPCMPTTRPPPSTARAPSGWNWRSRPRTSTRFWWRSAAAG
jgi:hypothetical protein